ncbi:hypothetical protein L1049_018523 [Liquidambar formosana]|uniref:TF-B3 domain-containing protein n=1 Tax=Liquidambar formosana TaxID=63359 RepID=A0AAP0WM45_LIQFO
MRKCDLWLQNIPKEFARSNGLCKNCYEMVLKNKNGRSWPVTLRHQLLSGQVNIGCGWQAFAVANGLKEGDKFKLELIRGENELIMTFYGMFTFTFNICSHAEGIEYMHKQNLGHCHTENA